MTTRSRRVLIALLVSATLATGLFVSLHWLLGPENLARMIGAWVQREWQAQLSLREPPGIRLVPGLQLSLRGALLERGQERIASAEELNVALPWSTLWSGEVRVDSLGLRRPAVAWPALTDLLADLTEGEPGPGAPRLPQIGIGVRIEDGEFHSGHEQEDWRLDRVSLLTTPLRSGDRFHLDAGARLRSPDEARSISLTLTTVPSGNARELMLEQISARLVVSPDRMPLSEGMVIQVQGDVGFDARGLARIDLDGHLPGWPDWLPNLLEFDSAAPVVLSIRWLSHDQPLLAHLGQGEHALEARLDAGSVQTAAALIDQPLSAIAALRGQWRLNALRAGDFQLQGIELDIGTQTESNGNEAAQSEPGSN